jgi:hypothetical protein
MEKFFKKLEAIAASLNITVHRDEAASSDEKAAFALDGITYTIAKDGQLWQVSHCSASQPESMVLDILLTHMMWRLQQEEKKYIQEGSQDRIASLDARRREIIEQVYTTYRFDEEVVDDSGWEFNGLDAYQRPVFLLQPEQPSRKVTFYVEFCPGNAEIHSFGVL